MRRVSVNPVCRNNSLLYCTVSYKKKVKFVVSTLYRRVMYLCKLVVFRPQV